MYVYKRAKESLKNLKKEGFKIHNLHREGVGSGYIETFIKNTDDKNICIIKFFKGNKFSILPLRDDKNIQTIKNILNKDF